jgi:putative transposase
MAEAGERLPMRVLAWCLIPTHFHAVLWPHEDGDLSRWMQWLLTSHVRRYHRFHHGSGHVWQGRFKAFPAQSDFHLLTVLKYIEANPLRAGLVGQAQQWPWSSARWRGGHGPPAILHAGPVELPGEWLELVNQPLPAEEVVQLRQCVNRGRPYGGEGWVKKIAVKLGLESALRLRGRPRKQPDEQEK